MILGVRNNVPLAFFGTIGATEQRQNGSEKLMEQRNGTKTRRGTTIGTKKYERNNGGTINEWFY